LCQYVSEVALRKIGECFEASIGITKSKENDLNCPIVWSRAKHNQYPARQVLPVIPERQLLPDGWTKVKCVMSGLWREEELIVRINILISETSLHDQNPFALINNFLCDNTANIASLLQKYALSVCLGNL
jgi:hypothetical protein